MKFFKIERCGVETTSLFLFTLVYAYDALYAGLRILRSYTHTTQLYKLTHLYTYIVF